MTDAAERKMRFLYALRSRGVTDPAVLSAMERIDRGLFVKGLDQNHAVMIAKDYLRKNAPVLDDGKLPGTIIIENIQQKFPQ